MLDQYETERCKHGHPDNISPTPRAQHKNTAEEQQILDFWKQQDEILMMQFDLNREEERQIKKPLIKSA